MEKKMKIFLMMIGLMGLVFVNACDDGGGPPKIPWTCINAGVDCPDGYIRDDGFPNDDGNTNDLLNDEMEDDEGLNPDPGTDPGVDAEQDPGNDDSGTNPDNPGCSEGERQVNIDGETPCLPIKTAETLEYLYNDNQGREFKVNGDVHQYFIFIYKKNYVNENENRCQGDNIDFILYLTSPAVVDILCIDSLSLSLSLCKNDASVCGDGEWITLFVREGKIFLSEGLYNVEFTLECMDPVPDQNRCDIQKPKKLFQEVKE